MNMNKDVESTLVIIKPDGMKNSHKIIDIFLDNGLNITYEDTRMLDQETLNEHYAHLVDKEFYPSLCEYMLSGDVKVLVVTGEDAVSRVRDLVGPTDSSIAPEWTIRGKFGENKQRNAVHASDSVENAGIEIKRFVKEK